MHTMMLCGYFLVRVGRRYPPAGIFKSIVTRESTHARILVNEEYHESRPVHTSNWEAGRVQTSPYAVQ